MLLNEFSYHRSVLKNEQHQNRLKLKTLLPHRSIYDGVENPFEKEEYSEEIKKVVVKGGYVAHELEGGEGEEYGEEEEDGEEELEGGEGELEGGEGEVELEGGEGEVELEGGDGEEVELEGGDGEEVEDGVEGGDGEEEYVEGGGEEEYVEGGGEEEEEEYVEGGGEEEVEEEGLEGGEEIGGVVFDNLSNKGGTSTIENVKNVVVSFF